MGRRKRNGIYEYYEYDAVAKKSKCLMEGCTAVLKGQHGANLLRHFHFRHKKEFKRVIEQNKEKAIAIKANKATNAPNIKATDPDIKDKLLQVLTDLETVYGRRRSLFDDEAFQNILNLLPIAKDSLDQIKQLAKEKAVAANGVGKQNATSSQENQRIDTPDPDDTSATNEQFDGQTLSVDFESVESSRVETKRDPLDDKTSDSPSTADSSGSEEEYAAPIQRELLTQRSRVRERRGSDVVRKNNAIADYYEAKKMKVQLEIKKLQLEMDMRKKTQKKIHPNNIDTINIKTENDH